MPPPTSASLRQQKRQGYVPDRVPNRKPTGDLNPVSEAKGKDPDRASKASTIKPAHSRGMSSISTINSFIAASSGETSSDAVSPIDGPGVRFDSVTSLPMSSLDRSQGYPNKAIKGTKRLLFALNQLQPSPSTTLPLLSKMVHRSEHILSVKHSPHTLK